MTGKVNTRRLLLLAMYLDKVPRKQFNMSFWGKGKIRKSYEQSCGFAGCAMGHACFIPSFKKLGLRLKQDGTNYEGQPKYILALKRSRLIGFNVVQRIFSVDEFKAEMLFAGVSSRGNDRGYESPKVVANRIRKFVAQVKEQGR